MSLADDIEIVECAGDEEECADEDLRAIGGATERWLFGELFRLPGMSEDECPTLPWQSNEPPRRRVRLGAYVAVFYLRVTAGGEIIAVVERVVRRSDLYDWLDREALRVQEEEEDE